MGYLSFDTTADIVSWYQRLRRDHVNPDTIKKVILADIERILDTECLSKEKE